MALQYNDKSPLENMHCAWLYNVLAQPENNIFMTLSRDEYKEARQICITTILHTDMASHQDMVRDLHLLYAQDKQAFERARRIDKNTNHVKEVRDEDVKEILEKNKMLCLCAILHSADVSNPCRKWEVSQKWAYACLEEFFLQGDQEKEHLIPVSFLNDREKLNKPNSQIGFIEFMIAPLFVAMIQIWPAMHEYGDNIVNNLNGWKDIWVAEIKPSEDDQKGVANRIKKVRTQFEEVMSAEGKTDG